MIDLGSVHSEVADFLRGEGPNVWHLGSGLIEVDGIRIHLVVYEVAFERAGGIFRKWAVVHGGRWRAGGLL